MSRKLVATYEDGPGLEFDAEPVEPAMLDMVF
jgi:hypothetical protein